VSLGFVLAAGAVAVWPGAGAGAGLVAPDKAAYWVQAQSTSLPSPLPAPPAPVVPAGGLYVNNGPDGPHAVAGLTYTVEGRLNATLTLHVHSYTTTNEVSVPAEPPAQPPSPNPALIHLTACVVEGPWLAPEGGAPGAWENRPPFNKDNCSLGQFSGDGSAVTFFLPADRQYADGLFDLAIVPDPLLAAEANTPFSVTFEAPREESLEAGDPLTPPPPDETPTTFYEPPTTVFDPGPVVPTPTIVGPSPSAPEPTTTTTAAARSRVFLPPRAAVPLAAIPDGRGERMMAVGLLMALAVGWWWFGGQAARGPQLLGSLAGEGRGPSRPVEPNGGIGRFARPRERRPRPLI
jgi:hypothetical protein